MSALETFVMFFASFVPESPATWFAVMSTSGCAFVSIRLVQLAVTSKNALKHGGPSGMLFDSYLKFGLNFLVAYQLLVMALFPFISHTLSGLHIGACFIQLVSRALLAVCLYTPQVVAPFYAKAILMRRYSHPHIEPEQRTVARLGLFITGVDPLLSFILCFHSARSLSILESIAALMLGVLAVAAVDQLVLVPRNAQSGSALRDSQNKKGENSYYYAHDGPVELPSSQTQSPPPKLLGVSSVKLDQVQPIDNYAFSDEAKKVKVYITFPAEITLTEDAVSFEWTETSIRLEVRLPEGGKKVMRVSKLYRTISGGSVKTNSSKGTVTISLKKADVMDAWHQLATDVPVVADDGICIDGRTSSS